jgi:hypothetical protein
VKKWVLDLKSRISQQYSEYPEYVVAMDEAVYSDVQSFRLFGCCKMGTNRFKEGGCSFNDSLLVIREENGSKAGRYIEYEGTQTTKTKKKKSDRSTSTGPTTTTTSFLPGFENCIGFESIRTWVREQKLEIDGSVQNKILALKNPSGYMCPIHQRIHENEKPYIYVNKGNYMFNCRRIQEHEGLSPFVIGRVLDELAVIEQDLDDMSIPTPFSRPIQSGSQGSNDQVARNSPHVFDGLDPKTYHQKVARIFRCLHPKHSDPHADDWLQALISSKVVVRISKKLPVNLARRVQIMMRRSLRKNGEGICQKINYKLPWTRNLLPWEHSSCGNNKMVYLLI